MAQTFHVRISDGPEQTITVNTGIYQLAAVSALAILGHDDLPVRVKIWVPELQPDYRPIHYVVFDDEFGRIVVGVEDRRALSPAEEG